MMDDENDGGGMKGGLSISPPDLLDRADREALSALYGCREVLGSVANIQHAIDLLEAKANAMARIAAETDAHFVGAGGEPSPQFIGWPIQVTP